MNISNTFPKSDRLLNPKQFRNVFDNTERKIHATHMMAFICSNQLNHARLGLAITKKKVPTAVARNNLKRLSRENFRLISSELKEKDIVIIVKRPIRELNNIQIREEIQYILQKIRKS